MEWFPAHTYGAAACARSDSRKSAKTRGPSANSSATFAAPSAAQRARFARQARASRANRNTKIAGYSLSWIAALNSAYAPARAQRPRPRWNQYSPHAAHASATTLNWPHRSSNSSPYEKTPASATPSTAARSARGNASSGNAAATDANAASVSADKHP